MTVIIGIDPHKASHTAVAIGCDEQQLAEIRVRATSQQTQQLLAWAEPLGKRTWAVESAGGMGYLLSQQLVGAGEQVLDVPATLASRVRVLGTGRSDKNDPNDALSVAIAALRSPRAPIGRARRPPGGAPSPGQTESRDRAAPQHRRLPASCCPAQPVTRWNLQRTQRF